MKATTYEILTTDGSTAKITLDRVPNENEILMVLVKDVNGIVSEQKKRVKFILSEDELSNQ